MASETNRLEEFSMFKIWRSPYIDYHASLVSLTTLDTEVMRLDEFSYSDAILREIAESGFNGIWVHGMLRELATHPLFPEFGTDAPLLREKLRTLIRRSAKFGIKVYLQMQPPRAVSGELSRFWERHADVAGSVERINWEDCGHPTPFISLCTSTEKVRQYLREAVASLSRDLPFLGGYIIISASEYPAHCWTRGGKNLEKMCPRCASRHPADVIAELLNTLYAGMRDTSPDQQLIAWNWGWADLCSEEDVISRLNRGIVPMADFERGGTFPLLGHRNHLIDEYALCYPGPAERFLASWNAARRNHALPAVKFQLGTTHENGALPNLPILPNLFTRADWFRKHRPSGFLGCWNFGNFASANTAAFNFFLSPEAPDDPEKAMAAFAEAYFPGCKAALAVCAWKTFAEAMKFYPHTWKFIYYAPTSWTLGYFVPPGPMSGKAGPTWLPDAERGDDISIAMPGPFSMEEILAGLARLSELWKNGLEMLSSALEGVESPHGALEFGNAAVCGDCFASLLNFLLLYRMKKETGEAAGEPYLRVCTDELAVMEHALPFVEADPRIGFHSEAQQYNFSAEMMKRKIKLLKEQLAGKA